MAAPKFVIKGQKELLRKLKALGSTRGAGRINKSAINAATTPMLRDVRALTPVDEGDLKKSMAKKITGKGFSADGIVGSDTSKVDADGERAARHLHLVNNGFEHEGGKTVPGVHMLERGFDASRAQCEQVYADKLAKGIEKEASK